MTNKFLGKKLQLSAMSGEKMGEKMFKSSLEKASLGEGEMIFDSQFSGLFGTVQLVHLSTFADRVVVFVG